jgi:hypothetical protein
MGAAMTVSAAEVDRYYAYRVPDLKRGRTHEWRGRCPIHKGDRRDSFAVNPNTGLWNCHSECGRGGDIIEFECSLTGAGFKEAKAEVFRIFGRVDESKERRNGHHRRQTVAEYDYRDERGELLFQTVRYEPKDFKQRRPDGKGDWIWNMQGVRLVPYRLPKVLAAEVIVICEGERDVHTLEALEVAATCSPMGAGKWRPEYSKHFRSKAIVIIPDNDEPGRKHAAEEAISVLAVAERVRIVELPKGKDATEWVQLGGTLAELKVLIQRAPDLTMESLVEWRAKWGLIKADARAVPAEECEPTQQESQRQHKNHLQVFGADELISGDYPDPLGMIDRLLYPGVTILQGAPKEGKSYFALQASLDLVNGWSFMSYFPAGKPRKVLYVALEDTKARTSRRLKQLGDCTDRLCDLRFVYSLDPWPSSLGQLDELMSVWPADVLIVDTLLGLLAGAGRGSTDIVRADYGVLNQIRELTEKHALACLVISHTKKHVNGLSDTDSGIGSTGISAGVDTLLTLRRRNEGTTMLSVLGREVERSEYELEFDLAKHNGWRVLASGAEAGLTSERREIVELLRQRGALPPKALAEFLGKKGPAVRRLLLKLGSDGVLSCNKDGSYYVRPEALS